MSPPCSVFCCCCLFCVRLCFLGVVRIEYKSILLLSRASWWWWWWCPKGFPMHDDRCLLFILLTCHRDYPACDVGAQFTFLQLALLLCFALVWARLLLCCLLAPRSAACARHEADAQQHTHSTVRVVPTFYTGARSYTDSISNVFFCFFSWRYWREGQTNTQNIPKRRDSVVLFLSFFNHFCFVVVAGLYRLLYYNGDGGKKSLWHGWKCK